MARGIAYGGIRHARYAFLESLGDGCQDLTSPGLITWLF